MTFKRCVGGLLGIGIACVLAAGIGDAAQTRGLSIKLRASEAADAATAGEVALYDASYALVIGIDAYTNGWPRLSNAVEDARVVAAELEKHGFFGHPENRSDLGGIDPNPARILHRQG